MPVKTPLAASIVPIPAELRLVLQIPPPDPVSVVVAPGQVMSEPLIETGTGLTDITVAILHPLGYI